MALCPTAYAYKERGDDMACETQTSHRERFVGFHGAIEHTSRDVEARVKSPGPTALHEVVGSSVEILLSGSSSLPFKRVACGVGHARRSSSAWFRRGGKGRRSRRADTRD